MNPAVRPICVLVLLGFLPGGCGPARPSPFELPAEPAWEHLDAEIQRARNAERWARDGNDRDYHRRTVEQRAALEQRRAAALRAVADASQADTPTDPFDRMIEQIAAELPIGLPPLNPGSTRRVLLSDLLLNRPAASPDPLIEQAIASLGYYLSQSAAIRDTFILIPADLPTQQRLLADIQAAAPVEISPPPDGGSGSVQVNASDIYTLHADVKRALIPERRALEFEVTLTLQRPAVLEPPITHRRQRTYLYTPYGDDSGGRWLSPEENQARHERWRQHRAAVEAHKNRKKPNPQPPSLSPEPRP